MRTHLLPWIAAIVVSAIVAAAYFGQPGSRPAAGPASLLGKPAPSFTIASLAGRPSGLAAYRGRIVVMNLWASWCPPCRAEMPDLQRLYSQYRSRDVVVVGIDQGESPQRVSSFARSLGIRYPLLIDQEQQYGRVYAALGLPTTFLVDRAGVIVRGFDGPLSYEQMTQVVSALLERRS